MPHHPGEGLGLLLFLALGWLQVAHGAAPLPSGLSWCEAAQDPGTSFRSTVTVSNDTALLAALLNPSVDGIQFYRDITLGPDWQALEAPIQLNRNVTLFGTKQVALDLGSVANAVYLGNAVLLTFSGLLLRQESDALLDPGLIWIAGAQPGAQLAFSNIRLQETCCISPSLWGRYRKDYNLSESIYSVDTTFVCDKINNCFEQQATFVQLCSAANSTPQHGSNRLRPYSVAWSHTVLLCEDSTTDSCMEANPAQTCLAQCVNNTRPQLPPSNGGGAQPPPATPNSGPSDVSTAAEVQTIILATVVPAGVVALLSIVGLLLWRHRRLRASSTVTGLRVHDKPGEGFCGLFGPCTPLDLEAHGSKPSRGFSGHEVVTKRSGTSAQAIRDAGATGSQAPEQQGSPSMSIALGPGGGPLRGPGSRPMFDAGHLRAVSLEPHLGMGPASSLQTRSAGVCAAPSASGHASRQSLAPGNGFDAAAAVASLAASREQHDTANVDFELIDLQKRVQQLAEERLILEDEKLVLGKAIGRGAFGMVFRGLWRNLDVAVKTMLFSQNDGARQENAIVEAALASSVVHPNVVSVYHFDMKPITVKPMTAGDGDSLHIEHGEGQTDWKMYIVQELCQTSLVETLDSWVFHDQTTGLPRMDLILSVLLDVACGCAHIHSKNIIWGDLKPGNVLLKMDPSKPHGVIAKITDFGMSTTIDPSLSHISNYNKGTPFYVAPEILLSHQATKTSDVFSFGILIQQMITRSTPYQRNEAGGVEVNKQFWRPTPGSCPALTDLRRRCLDQNPKNRPSFDDIVKCLQEVYDLHLARMAPSTAGAVAVDACSTGRDPAGTAAAAVAASGSAGSCQDPSPAGQASHHASSAGQWDSRPGLAHTSATASTPTHDQGHPQAMGLGSHSVPTRSTSAFINHEAALGLHSLQSQSPLFANWPMSDGALQGMQLLEPQQALHGQPHAACQGVDGQPTARSGAGPHHLEMSSDPHGHAPYRDLFPNWSTQF